MSEKIEELKIINWKISLKNGTSLDLNVRDGDAQDCAIRDWVNGLSKKPRTLLYGSFEQSDVWVSADEFSMALRSPFMPKQPSSVADFAKIEDNASDLP